MEKLIAPSQKVLRHPCVLAKIKNGERVYPVNVEFDLSDACNLKCEWCAFAGLRRPLFMPPFLAVDILAQLSAAGVKAITFSGGGEPTLNPDFRAIVSAAAEMGFDLGLYTNGLDITRLLPVAGLFKWIYISVDAASAVEYKREKGAGGFTRVLANAARLKKGGARTLGLGFLLNGDNWRGFRDMLGLRMVARADYVQFRPAVGLDSYRWVPAALTQLKEIEGEGVYVSRERFLDLYFKRERDYAVCRGSELAPCVGADGTLWVCPNTRGLRALGDLKAETLEAIWQRRPVQAVGPDCRAACRNHYLNQTLDYVCGQGPHDSFV